MDPAWDEYRRRRRAFFKSLLWALLWIVPGSLISSLLVHIGFAETQAGLVVVLPMLGCIVTALRWSYWPCPHCGRPFHVNMSWLYCNVLSRRCLNCRLPLWAPNPAQSGQPSPQS